METVEGKGSSRIRKNAHSTGMDERCSQELPMTYMMAINPDEMRAAIKEKMSLMAMSKLLLPDRIDPYRQFRYWLRHGRMPREKHTEMMEILNGSLHRTETTD